MAVVAELIQELASTAIFDRHPVVAKADIHLVKAFLTAVVVLMQILVIVLKELIIIIETVVLDVVIGLSLALLQEGVLLFKTISPLFMLCM